MDQCPPTGLSQRLRRAAAIFIPLRSCCGHTFTADDVDNDDNDSALSRAKDSIVGKCDGDDAAGDGKSSVFRKSICTYRIYELIS